MIRKTYERFTDYLFGKMAYAQLCMRDGQLDEIPAIFDHHTALHDLYPGRRLFHMSEIVAFFCTMTEYKTRSGDFDVAERFARTLLDLVPDHPQVKRTVELLASARVLRRRFHDILADERPDES